MVAHTQTLFGAVALVAVLMGSCLILVGRLDHRDGMLTTGLGMLSHSLAYVGYTLFGHAPLWISYVLANTLLSTAMAFYTVSLPLIHGRPPPWKLAFTFPVVQVVLLTVLLNTQIPRQLTACMVLLCQCLLVFHFSRRYSVPGGRAHRVLLFGSALSLTGLGMRVVVILSGAPAEMHYNVSNLKQTFSVSIGAATVLMLSFGLVLLSRERIESQLRQTAMLDTLTGIPNRRAIIEHFTDEIERACRLKTPLAIAMLDVDHFKRINDSYGHLIGDDVLKYCATHLQRRLRRHDHVGRYGGEEFLLVLPGTDADGALQLVDQLRRTFCDKPARFAGHSINLSFSAGICGVSHVDEHTNLTELLHQADTALYAAKNAGRNTLRVAGAREKEEAFKQQ
ncbi:GGDEF domain-containing protein [Pseudomonas sp. NCCP-436]|uniref:GGDEF domain-containing protein n=1 Tax=Pseudomonas sp. NCCP-436 TaxID=2842481 RepID=UPI001C7F0FC7|nr:GGDEF domain-containing protein [Pseudomonas sp. NCCP-436]GIZ10664.1 hypothetical protein NCCP436_00800 [Pseudomonas sp. NCCP-436]